MAQSIYSIRFIAVHDQPALAQAQYVVPAGKVLVLRDVDVYRGAALSTDAVLVLGSAGQVVWQESWAINIAGWRGFRGREIWYAGETLAIESTAVIDMTASGYLLTAP